MGLTISSGLSTLIDLFELLPWSLVVGTANISFPPIHTLSNTMSGLAPFGDSIAKALLAIVIVRLVAAVLALGGALVGAFNNNIRLQAVLNTLAFATLANVSLLIGATVVTIEVAGTSESVGSFGKALGLEVTVGTNFIVVEWVAAVCSLVGTFYWLSVWFVEYRTVSFSRITRHPDDVGNWFGLWYELRNNWRGLPAVKVAGKTKDSDEELLVVPARRDSRAE